MLNPTVDRPIRPQALIDFLPGVLEIQERPPHPLTRWTAGCLIALFCLALIWAVVGKIDVMSTAEGKIILSSRSKPIQPFEKSVVKRMLVKEGDSVTRGQPLVELDAAITAADRNGILANLISAKANLAISKSFLSILDHPDPQQNLITNEDIAISLHELLSDGDQLIYRSLLWQQWKEYQSHLVSLKSKVQNSSAAARATSESIIKLEKTLLIKRARSEKLADLFSKGYVAELEFLDAEQEKIRLEQDLAIERERLAQLAASIEEASQNIVSFTAQSRSEHLSRIATGTQQISTLQEDLVKASDLNNKKTLHSPVAGRVQQLAAVAEGSVVTDAQQLMVIVPSDEPIEIDATLENKDIGFVSEGMEAEIKVHTFPFTKYGVIKGEVTNISDDAVFDEKLGWVYAIRIKMDEVYIMVNDKRILLTPGMTVSAEIKTNKRRIIEYFLSPVLKHASESLNER